MGVGAQVQIAHPLRAALDALKPASERLNRAGEGVNEGFGVWLPRCLIMIDVTRMAELGEGTVRLGARDGRTSALTPSIGSSTPSNPSFMPLPTGMGRSWVLRFNHVANRVNPGHFQTVVDMFVQQLGFVELRRTERAAWLRQPGANIDLQLSRSDTGHRDHDRERSQVSFLSDTPEEDLDRLASWLVARGLQAHVSAYSDREFYLDAPE